MLFQIGVGVVEKNVELGSETFVYKSFLVNDFTEEEEKRICIEFINFIKRENYLNISSLFFLCRLI